MGTMKFGELLVQAGLIDHSKLEAALAAQRKTKLRLGEILVILGYVKENEMIRSLSQLIRVPAVDLTRISAAELTNQVLNTISPSIAKLHSIVPLAIRNIRSRRRLVIATSDPTQLDLFDRIQFESGIPLLVMLAPASRIDWFIRRYYFGEEVLPPENPNETNLKARSFGSQRTSCVYSDLEFVQELLRASAIRRRGLK